MNILNILTYFSLILFVITTIMIVYLFLTTFIEYEREKHFLKKYIIKLLKN